MSFGKVYESYNINCLFKIFQELCTFICNVVGRRVFAEMLFCVEDSVVAQLLCLYFGINVRYLGQHRSVSFFFFFTVHSGRIMSLFSKAHVLNQKRYGADHV